MASAQEREPAVTDIHVPDDALKDGAKRMRLVQDNIDIGNTTFDFDAAFGRELSSGAAQNFEDRWNDGKHQLQKQVGASSTPSPRSPTPSTRRTGARRRVSTTARAIDLPDGHGEG
jgi:hypothetical protein